jgi:hypothetical protein
MLVLKFPIAAPAEELTSMHTPIAASVAATVENSPAWVKNAARVTFLALFIKGAVWVGASWLAMRGFGAL